MRSPAGLKEKDRILQNATKSCGNTLVLRGQYFQTIPRDVFQPPFLHNLCILELGYNNLQYLPPEIGHLTCLQELYVQNNVLRTLPEELGNLAALRKLSLCHNQLVEVPLFFGGFVKLEWVNLSGNFIEVLPAWILILLPRLKNLYILHNPIENVPRDVYIHGLDKVRELFKVRVPEIVDESQSVDTWSGFPDSPGKMKRSLFSELQSASIHCTATAIVEPKVGADVERRISPQNETKVFQVRAVDRPPANPLPQKEKLSSLYAKKYEEITNSINKSHSQGLELIKEQKEKIRLRQELRKLNISYLQHRNARRQLQFFPLSRQSSNLSLDLEIPHRDRRNRRQMTTSEYGTCSSLTDGSEPVNHLQGFDGQLWPIIADDETNETSTIFSSDFDSCHPGNASEDQLVSDNFEIDIPLDRRRHITLGDISVVIPEYNISGHFQSEFSIEVLEDMSYSPQLKCRQALASEVLRIEPHGAKFHPSDPAMISMPYDIKVGPNDRVTCLCNDTGLGQRPRWAEMQESEYKVFQTHVEIQATHFSLFAVVVSKGYPEAHKTIRVGVGGCLYVQEVPGVELNFPKTSLLYDIDASVKVLYGDEPYDTIHGNPSSLALATPVIEVGPHGCQFNPHTSDSVTVRLPLPNGKQIVEQFGDSQLTFWCSSTRDDEALNWQQFQPSMVYIDTEDSSLCSVYFTVTHFSFFTAAWNIIDVVWWETKVKASQILQIFDFYISCQALMSESEDGIRFGICVLCYRFGKEMEGIGNFPIPVGSHCPKMIRTGEITIRLQSGLFKADTSVGENELTQKERFTGRPFVKQFACMLTGEIPSYGNFGKVTIEQPSLYGTECLFSFNLCKPNTSEPYDSSLAWEVQLTKELSGLLSINAERDMGDEVWQDLADSLGYTNREIAKFSSCDEPLTMMIADYKRRGGQAGKFIEALYRTGPKSTGLQTARPQASTSSSHEIMDDERSEILRTEPKICPGVKNIRKRKHDEVAWEDKFSELASKLPDKWQRLGRALKLSENKIREIELDYKDKVQEQAYQMLLSWRDEQPDQCTLVTLSKALCKIGMGYVARQCCMAVELG